MDLDYLSSRAGDIEVLVEPIHPTSKQYGTDVERIPMPFREFITSLRSSDEPHLYLTTQYSEQDEDQHTVLPPPACALADDFPTVPRIMGNLCLQQVNLWVGKSQEGSTSGLHHDFHDNLYCLLQGRKRFVLYPPQEVENLYPYGNLDNLYSNDLISYKDAPVRSDGLPVRVALQARIKAIEQKLEAMRKGKGKDKTASKDRKALMELYDQALDELAQMTLDGEGGFDINDEVDDFDALMARMDRDDGDPDEAGPSGLSGGHDEDDEEDDDEDEADDEEGEGLVADNIDENAHKEPSSFSRIPTALVHQHLNLPTTAVPPTETSLSDFPNFTKASTPYIVELNAGEMLYLPASWWHEVTSSSGNGNGIHMAFNYWFYPPTGDSFKQPYEDTLIWEYLRQQNVDKAIEESLENGKKRKSVGSALQEKKKIRQ
ncbi:unnamed protein product [Somion occarium]|uniref:JmjC domain-containing protein n=1 Tax=Somion occarium TaxID=3059160 RepID=A0ABP1CS26_9APHY